MCVCVCVCVCVCTYVVSVVTVCAMCVPAYLHMYVMQADVHQLYRVNGTSGSIVSQFEKEYKNYSKCMWYLEADQ